MALFQMDFAQTASYRTASIQRLPFKRLESNDSRSPNVTKADSSLPQCVAKQFKPNVLPNGLTCNYPKMPDLTQ